MDFHEKLVVREYIVHSANQHSEISVELQIDCMIANEDMALPYQHNYYEYLHECSIYMNALLELRTTFKLLKFSHIGCNINIQPTPNPMSMQVPLLFCLVLAPLSFLLQREKVGYSFRDGQVINHLSGQSLQKTATENYVGLHCLFDESISV